MVGPAQDNDKEDQQGVRRDEIQQQVRGAAEDHHPDIEAHFWGRQPALEDHELS